MIPKASQRGLGQDLATHLQNAYDNEYVEIAEVRGAVARTSTALLPSGRPAPMP